MNYRLLIVRHAEAEDIKEGQKDFDRNLTENGVNEAENLNLRIKNDFNIIKKVFVSPAARTLQTAQIALKGIEIKSTEQLEKIFSGSASELEGAVREFFSTTQEEVGANEISLCVIGHNPVITYLLNLWVPDAGYMHTCQCVEVMLNESLLATANRTL